MKILRSAFKLTAMLFFIILRKMIKILPFLYIFMCMKFFIVFLLEISKTCLGAQHHFREIVAINRVISLVLLIFFFK